MAKNPLIRSYPKKVNTPQPNKSAGILDDYAVRKVIATKEGSITRVPTDPIDIVNKAYVDSNDFWERVGDVLSPKVAANVDLGNKALTFTHGDISSSPGGDITFNSDKFLPIAFNWRIDNVDVLTIDDSGNFDFKDGNLTTTGAVTVGDATHGLDMSNATLDFATNPFIKFSDKTVEGFKSGINRVAAGHEFFVLVGDQASRTVFGSGIDGDATRRFIIMSDGEMQWGTGSAARDVNLYKSASNTLKTDDVFISDGNFMMCNRLIIDGTHANALDIRKASNGGDVFNVDTTNSIITAWADLLFVGSGSGLAFGEIYVQDNTTETVITTAGKANKVQINIFDIDGASNNTSPNRFENHILITKAGYYRVSVDNFSVSSSGGDSDVLGFSLYKNNGATEFPNVHTHRKFSGGAGDRGVNPMGGICFFNINDTIEVWGWNESDNDNFTVDDINLNIIQIGG